jgi:hypothetical protein
MNPALYYQIMTVVGLLVGANAQIAAFVDAKGWARDFGQHAPAWRQFTVFVSTLFVGALAGKAMPSFDEVMVYVQNLHIFD